MKIRTLVRFKQCCYNSLKDFQFTPIIIGPQFIYLSSACHVSVARHFVIALITTKTVKIIFLFCLFFRAPVEKTRPCVVDFLKVSRRCLRSKDKPSLDITLHMIDAAIDFMCHNRGDRIACKHCI